MLDSRTVQGVALVLFAVLVALVVALFAGLPVPRPLVAGVVLIQVAVRAYRDWRWGGAMGRRRIPISLAISLFVAYALVTSR